MPLKPVIGGPTEVLNNEGIEHTAGTLVAGNVALYWGVSWGVIDRRKSTSGGQEAGASAAGLGVAGVAAFAGAFRAAGFLLVVALAAEILAALRSFGRTVALAGVAAAAGVAALFTLAQRAF